jgi:hypothetical protein
VKYLPIVSKTVGGKKGRNVGCWIDVMGDGRSGSVPEPRSFRAGRLDLPVDYTVLLPV